LKVGDRLYCHSVCKLHSGTNSTTVGNTYIILFIELDDSFMIIDDDGDEHFFGNDYQKWFWDLRELRKNKLKKIKNNQKI
jgi:hypothetical protein